MIQQDFLLDKIYNNKTKGIVEYEKTTQKSLEKHFYNFTLSHNVNR